MNKEEVIEAYRNALKLYGVSELAIERYVAAFITGYEAGVLSDGNDETKDKIVHSLQYEDKLN